MLVILIKWLRLQPMSFFLELEANVTCHVTELRNVVLVACLLPLR